MKLSELYNELIDVAKKSGITVRKEKGTFKSGYCVLKDEDLIILNSANTIETLSNILAKSLTEFSLDNAYIKPAVRDFIEKERVSAEDESGFKIEIK